MMIRSTHWSPGQLSQCSCAHKRKWRKKTRATESRKGHFASIEKLFTNSVNVALSTGSHFCPSVERSPRHSHAQFLSLYIHILSPPWFSVLNMYLFRNFTYSPPRFLAPSLTHRTYQPYDPLPSLLQRVFLRPPSPVLPTLRPHSLSTHFKAFTTLFTPSLSQTHPPSHLFPLPPLPYQPLNPHINCTLGSQYPW